MVSKICRARDSIASSNSSFHRQASRRATGPYHQFVAFQEGLQGRSNLQANRGFAPSNQNVMKLLTKAFPARAVFTPLGTMELCGKGKIIVVVRNQSAIFQHEAHTGHEMISWCVLQILSARLVLPSQRLHAVVRGVGKLFLAQEVFFYTCGHGVVPCFGVDALSFAARPSCEASDPAKGGEVRTRTVPCAGQESGAPRGAEAPPCSIRITAFDRRRSRTMRHIAASTRDDPFCLDG